MDTWNRMRSFCGTGVYWLLCFLPRILTLQLLKWQVGTQQTYALSVLVSHFSYRCCSQSVMDFTPAFLWDLAEVTSVFPFTGCECSQLSLQPAYSEWIDFDLFSPAASLLPILLLINFCTREWARAMIKTKLKLVNEDFWEQAEKVNYLPWALSEVWCIYAIPDSYYCG